MERLIIYGSQYGTTKRYAQRFSEMTGIPSLSYEAANDLTDCRLLVYFGGLYAGGLKGFRHIVKLLPERQMIYDEDAFTDKSINFLICEHIRGLLLEKLDNEIPHGVAVVVDRVSETSDKVFMDISIIVEKERHKGFIIGKNGVFIKELGISAREYAESLFRKQVVLHLFVKVDENWRVNNINKYGY